MKKTIIFALATFIFSLSIQAQRIGCIHSQNTTRAEGTTALPQPFDFDPQKTYRQPVLLINFSDTDFSMDNPAEYYNRLFNEHQFNQGSGPGSIADYFRDQSSGRVNLVFDIYGPVRVSGKANGRSFSNRYGYFDVREALQELSTTVTNDFSIYDWDGDKEINQIIIIFASYSGNDKSGYIWPNTGFNPHNIKLPGDVTPNLTSISCELWEDGKLCGIGTIIHEFCHSLGLPDLYPLPPASSYSEFDEWDVMDGGNYVDRGWCPPNLSTVERMYLGWYSPTELNEPTSIRDMKSLAEGGEAYIIRNSANASEYYILENRQQKGWDYGIPGNGLLISHIDFDQGEWLDNRVNISDTHFRCHLVNADGKSYINWDKDNNGKDEDHWTMGNRMRSKYLSTSAYPYTDSVTMAINNALTDDSNPAASLYNPAADGRKLLGKPITNIKQADDGTISFDFMGGSEGANIGEIHNAQCIMHNGAGAIYDLSGRRISVFSVSSVPSVLPKGVYIVNGQKLFVK